MKRPPDTFVQEMEERYAAPFGPVLYVRIRTENYRRLGWRELWETIADAYPDRWALEWFPPASALVDEANIYHLFVMPLNFEPPHGMTLRRAS